MSRQQLLLTFLLFSFFIFFISTSLFASERMFPGKTPDCWEESRIVHRVYAGTQLLNDNLTISRVDLDDSFGKRIYSPNKGYWYQRDGIKGEVLFTISAEKDHALQFKLANVHGVSDDKWINEKLIFLRIWWGRIALTDVIFDVEQEVILYSETAMDGYLAHLQFRESCLQLGGCDCIKKEE